MSSELKDTTLAGRASAYATMYGRIYQSYLDKTVPHTGARWGGFAALLVLFMLRIVYAQGWYIICYGLGIYLLNLFLLFLQPKFDPSLEQEIRDQDIEEGVGAGASAGEGSSSGTASSLPTTRNDEFRPFIRRLPEFKFWYNATRAALFSFVATWFSIFDVPVFWPILLIYFCVLFTLTMRRQIQHMIKYKYLPFDFGKAKYGRA